MQQTSERRSRSRIGKVLGTAAAAALCLAAFSQSDLAHAGPHGGGGGFHGAGGGGFHSGGFHGGGFHGGGFHGGGFHGGFHGGGFHSGSFHAGRFFGGAGFGGYYPYDDGDYGYAAPSYSQTWYYCANPVGYYPYVMQCYTGWQAVSG
jgi:uncharacterized membrane protein